MKTWAAMTAALWMTFAGSAASADDLRAVYESQVGYALHLLEAGRYGEAEDAAQNLVTAYPDAALPYEVRGTAALYVGSLKFARKDFDRASQISQDDAPEPAAQYGLALCDLFGQNLSAAAGLLTDLRRQRDSTEAQTSDLAGTQAYVALLQGDISGASALAGQSGNSDNSLAAEIAALAAYKTDSKEGAARLVKFLATPDGVPVVREQDGLRPLFDPQSPLEPCVLEPELQQMYADRLAGNVLAAVKRTGAVQACSGVVDLNPPQTLPSRTALLSYSVDGQMAAMVSQPPFTWTWNTARVANGTHVVQIQAVDVLGNPLATQTETVRVSNRNAAFVRQADDPDMEALKARLWNLMTLRPSRKVAEWTLAQAYRASGDTVSAGTHLAIAAALDPAYKNGRNTAQALFGPPPALLSLSSGTGKLKQIALTFDDGPSPAKTPALLDALEKAHAPATFFVVGSRAAAAPALLRRMAQSGDEVENHSYTHPNMNLVPGLEAESEILRGNVTIEALTGHQPHFFRPPGGNANTSVQHLAHIYGLTVAYWAVDALHYEDLGSPSGLVRYVLAHVHPGSVILMHNGPDVTAAAVPGLVSGLRARGYSLVTLSEIANGQTNTPAKMMPKMKE
jgi:peptidoglycan/xylan/chitin deacetylase (PgdA/CDA1 family)/Tfp pilus assembly protein PilF